LDRLAGVVTDSKKGDAAGPSHDRTSQDPAPSINSLETKGRVLGFPLLGKIFICLIENSYKPHTKQEREIHAMIHSVIPCLQCKINF
jgi:hypothetical protein